MVDDPVALLKEQNKENIYDLFHRGFDHLGIDPQIGIIEQLAQYCHELIKWNKKVNLIAKNTPVPDIIEKHFLDSLTLYPVLQTRVPERGKLLDVGSGAGFPGLVVKIVSPARPVVLLEPRQRRATFLNHIIRTLQLQDVQVCQQRTDELVSSAHEQYAVITGRAVADVASFLDMVQCLAGSGTLIACMQGASGRSQWENVDDSQDYAKVASEHFRLPFSGAERSILLFRKR